MVLPGAQLFPNAPLPLYIFEPRYRAMLAWALDQDRMFCIASMKPGISEARTADDFHHIVGLGLVRACVGREDGTSHLVLQGLARMRITGFLQEKPFRIAELRELPSQPAPAAENERLVARLLKTCTHIFAGHGKAPESLEQQLEQIDDPAVLSDLIAYTCLDSAEVRQAVFEELDVIKRVALLIEHLRAEGSGRDGGEA